MVAHGRVRCPMLNLVPKFIVFWIIQILRHSLTFSFCQYVETCQLSNSYMLVNVKSLCLVQQVVLSSSAKIILSMNLI